MFLYGTYYLFYWFKLNNIENAHLENIKVLRVLIDGSMIVIKITKQN